MSQFSLPIQFVKASFKHIPSKASMYTCNALTHVRPVVAIEQQCFARHSEWEKVLHQATDHALKDAILTT